MQLLPFSQKECQTKYVKIPEKSSLSTMQQLLSVVADEVRQGKLVVFPTETVYGLGASFQCAEAIQRIFDVKGRPGDNPLIVHISDINDLSILIGKNVPKVFYRLTEIFWPGPVTFVVPKSELVSGMITGGRDSVAIRFPSHPVAQVLISLIQHPVAAPSANLSGKPSSTRVEHLKELEGKVDWIIDAGAISIGLESTIISLLQDPPVLLRPGPITVEKIKEIIPDLQINLKASKALAPGMKYRHYAPEAQLFLVPYAEDLQKLVKQVQETYLSLKLETSDVLILGTNETVGYYTAKGYSVLSMGSRNNLYSIAQNLFHSLRSVDDLGYSKAIIEGFDEVGLGLALMNRIQKAVSSK